jgi:N-acetyl-1-D-myo-inositol-2-amino-2-deoxy-alpha-D-glucopyranoside deacetylase
VSSEEAAMSDRTTARDADRMGPASTVVACVFAVVIGGIVGLLTTFVHAQVAPWGLVAGLVIVVLLVTGFRLVFASRPVGAAAAVGVVIGGALLALPAAGSPVLAPGAWTTWVWAIGAVVLAVAALVPSWRGRAAERP